MIEIQRTSTLKRWTSFKVPLTVNQKNLLNLPWEKYNLFQKKIVETGTAAEWI